MSLSDQSSQAAGNKARQAVRAFLGNVWGADTISNVIGALVATAETLAVALVGSVFRVGANVAEIFLLGIDDVKHNNQDAINGVMAAALSEIMGVEVSSSDLPSGGGAGAGIQLNRAIGGKVLGTLTTLMGGSTADTPGPGETAAEGFMGFGINFTVAGAILGLVTELESLGFIHGFAELSEELEQSLGIGRLMRVALRPIMNALIVLPYTREVNAKYHPVRLSAAEYIQAYHSGRMSADDLKRNLSEHGYDDLLQAELMTQHEAKIAAKAVDVLVRWGKLTADQALDTLQHHGMMRDRAQVEMDVIRFEQADQAEHSYIAEAVKLTQERALPVDSFHTLLDRTHFSEDVKQGYRNRVGLTLDTPKRSLTLKEMLYLAEHNLVTNAHIEQWAAEQGYTPDAAALLDLWITQQELDWDAIQAKKKKPPKPPKTPPPSPVPAGG